MDDETRKIIEEKDAIIKTLKERITQLQNLLLAYQTQAAQQYHNSNDYYSYPDDEDR